MRGTVTNMATPSKRREICGLLIRPDVSLYQEVEIDGDIHRSTAAADLPCCSWFNCLSDRDLISLVQEDTVEDLASDLSSWRTQDPS